MSQYHALLMRQLRKHFGSREIPEAISGFVEHVNEAYHQADDDRRMLERAFELSSNEMLEANQELAAALHALADAKDRAERANQSKDEFLAVLGHELRNPLAPLVTALDSARLRGSRSVDCRDIDRPLRQVVRLVDDLLDVARAVRGTIALDKRPFELAVAAKDAIEAASPLVADRDHTLEVDLPPQGLLVDGDEARIAQVIVNLLTNAARCTEPGGTIRIEACTEGSEVVLRVQDSGVGIEAEDLATLFDSFGRQRRSGAQRSAGLGLGLTIVRNMVGLHGGSVSAHSDGLGKGATFEVRLPRSTREGEDGKADAPSSVRRAVTVRRVLVVDDNREAAELLVEALREAGHEVILAHDPGEALARAAVFSPEVAVLDVGLPEMSGHELGGLLRAQCSPAPRLIALTGYGRSTDHEASARAGFAVHLVKPVGLRDLLDAIGG